MTSGCSICSTSLAGVVLFLFLLAYTDGSVFVTPFSASLPSSASPWSSSLETNTLRFDFCCDFRLVLREANFLADPALVDDAGISAVCCAILGSGSSHVCCAASSNFFCRFR